MTSIFPTTHHLIATLKQILGTLTRLQEGTAIPAPSPELSWQEVTTILYQTK